jgi:hypothetical protein
MSSFITHEDLVVPVTAFAYVVVLFRRTNSAPIGTERALPQRSDAPEDADEFM